MLNWVKAGASKIIWLAYSVWREVSETAVAVFAFPVEINVLRGQLRGGSESEVITALYVGRNLNQTYFKNKFFKEVEVVQSKRANLLTYRKYEDEAEDGVDIKFVDIGWPYHSRINKHGEYLELPDWLCMVAPISDTWDETVANFRKTMRKNIKRLIRKNNYTCRQTNDPEDIKAFHDDFYDAFINYRYSAETVMTPRITIENRAAEGTILQAIGKDGPVAAGVYFPAGEEFCLLASGMPAKLVENPAEAGISALYYFSLQYAFENSFKAVNFMGTRALPNDGLFQFKRKWGAAAKDAFSIDSILFKPMNNSPMAARFCELNPLIARRGEKLELVLCTTAEDLSADDYLKLVSASHCDELDPVRIVHVTNEKVDQILVSEAQPTVHIIQSTLGTLSQKYVAEAPDSALTDNAQ